MIEHVDAGPIGIESKETLYYANFVALILLLQAHTTREVDLAHARTARILLAKPGLDGHDRGAKVVAHALKDAGFEVIYTGLHQTVEMIVQSAVEEDVDVIGLSIMSGAHVPICRKLLGMLKEKGAEDIMVLVGGVIPSKDVSTLKKIGVSEVFPGGSDIDAPAKYLSEHFTKHPDSSVL